MFTESVRRLSRRLFSWNVYATILACHMLYVFIPLQYSIHRGYRELRTDDPKA